MSKNITVQNGFLVIDLAAPNGAEPSATATFNDNGLLLENTGGDLHGFESDTFAATDKAYVGVYNDETAQYVEIGVHGSTFGAGSLNATMYMSTDVGQFDFLGDYKNLMQFVQTSAANSFVDIADGTTLRSWDDDETNYASLQTVAGTATLALSFSDGDFNIEVQDGNLNLGTNAAFTGTTNIATGANVGTTNISGTAVSIFSADAASGAALDINLTTGDGLLAANAGGDFVLEVGTGAGTGASGNVFINTTTGIGAQGGTVDSSEAPGLVSIYGVNTSGEIQAGNVEIWGGYASGSTTSSIGGDVMIFGGGGGGSNPLGGDVCIYGGASDDAPGNVEIEGGTATVNGAGGNAIMIGGPGFGTNKQGGSSLVTGGLGIGTGIGGGVVLQGGDSGSGATGSGGNISIHAGDALSTNGPGGNITIIGGDHTGSGTAGAVILAAGQNSNVTELRFLETSNINYVGFKAANSFSVDVVWTLPVTDSSGTQALVSNGSGVLSWQSILAGTVTSSGAPLANEVAVFTSGTDIDSDATFTWDGTILSATRVLTGVGAAATPGVAIGENDTGWYRPITDVISATLGGTQRWSFQAAQFSGAGDSATMLYADPSATAPSLVPRTSDLDTGVGQAASDQLSLIAGGVEILRLVETGTATTDQVIIGPAGIIGTAGTPALAFGDGNTGFYESVDNTLITSIGGTSRWQATGTLYGSNTGAGGTMQTAASAILPGHTFANDLNTGIGTNAADELSLIAGGVEANRIVAATLQTTAVTTTEIISVAVASGEGFGFEIHLIGTEDATGDSVFERVFGAIRNQGGTTALVGNTITDRTDDAGATTWVITVAADDAGDALTVDVAGEAAHTIDWKVRVHLLNV